LISKYNMKKVRKAINENDFDLAKENYDILVEFLKEHNSKGTGLAVSRLDSMTKWLTSKNPLSDWDTLAKTTNSWDEQSSGRGDGIERLLD